ncbi:class I SAM-dependent methyltransferase, partial [Natronomonas sp.]|uniref:class I SAM-dependent methyltransferase n=1 Tax=Natronomonas sp. TaxID=2184060 RepID=UPI002FC39A63
MSDDWNATDYDDHHDFVYEYGADLLGLLDPSPDEWVLDLGCGTGHLTAEVATDCESAVGVDRSESMVRDARKAYPALDFVRGDARRLPFDGVFDAVLSNAALHWVASEAHDSLLTGVADA